MPKTIKHPTLPKLATRRWQMELTKDIKEWLEIKQEQWIEEVAQKFSAAQQEDPEYGLETYRFMDLGTIFRAMRRSRPIVDPFKGRVTMELFPTDSLEYASRHRSTIYAVSYTHLTLPTN